MTTDESQNFLAMLKTDLRAAMRERKAAEMTTLRGLISAIDNAQAVPVSDKHDTYVFHAFGDSAVEVPRRALGHDDIRALVEAEIRARNDAAADYRRLGRDDKAQELTGEVQILSRYLGPHGSS
ncbi:GatB/YqeY domain-containing protein [Bosea sp. MMO-172]|uniref:GatB/YqeY domain-containing protein n=1 Tax=Bosea sp. MMO-172 TaxID=3127885 RepID=UPI0030162731